MLSRQEANVIAKKAMEVLSEAFKKDPALSKFAVSDAGGSIGRSDCTIKFQFRDTSALVLAGPLTDDKVKNGLAIPGSRIVFNKKTYTVIRAKQRYYLATEEDSGKNYNVPIIYSSAAV